MFTFHATYNDLFIFGPEFSPVTTESMRVSVKSFKQYNSRNIQLTLIPYPSPAGSDQFPSGFKLFGPQFLKNTN